LPSLIRTRAQIATRELRLKIIKFLFPEEWKQLFVTSFPPIKDIPRGSTLYATEHFKKRPIVYCEVGVEKGENSFNVIEMLNIKHAYLIDFYEEYTTNYTGQPSLITKDMQDVAFKTAKKRLAPFKDKITWIQKNSDKAAKDLPADVDFIYIDANHAYEYVKKDIELYWEKVAENGILAGHDCFGTYNGVINAIHEFAMKKKIHIHSNFYDWWFIQEEKR